MDLIYCDKKSSNTGHCSNIACYSAMAVSKKTKKEYVLNRCEEHKLTSTANKKIVSLIKLDQKEELDRVNKLLHSLIGKNIFSNFHRNKYPLVGKYLKDNGGIMCKDSRGKWQYVYYRQIQNKEELNTI